MARPTATRPHLKRSAFFDVVGGSNGSCGGDYLCTGTRGYDAPRASALQRPHRPLVLRPERKSPARTGTLPLQGGAFRCTSGELRHRRPSVRGSPDTPSSSRRRSAGCAVTRASRGTSTARGRRHLGARLDVAYAAGPGSRPRHRLRLSRDDHRPLQRPRHRSAAGRITDASGLRPRPRPCVGPPAPPPDRRPATGEVGSASAPTHPVDSPGDQRHRRRCHRACPGLPRGGAPDQRRAHDLAPTDFRRRPGRLRGARRIPRHTLDQGREQGLGDRHRDLDDRPDDSRGQRHPGKVRGLAAKALIPDPPT